MPMYYFNVMSASDAVLDFEGSDLPDIATARIEAIKDARELMSNAILEGRDISSRRIEICNEAGDVLLDVAFTEAVSQSE